MIELITFIGIALIVAGFVIVIMGFLILGLTRSSAIVVYMTVTMVVAIALIVIGTMIVLLPSFFSSIMGA